LRSDWEPTADHYPRLKMHGGHLTPDNVRLAHQLRNRRDYWWRVKINAMLGKRMSLEAIDLVGTMADLEAKGAQFTGPVEKQDYGFTVMLHVPGADDVMLYEPRHPVAHSL
jgi:hypothetical protein